MIAFSPVWYDTKYTDTNFVFYSIDLVPKRPRSHTILLGVQNTSRSKRQVRYLYNTRNLDVLIFTHIRGAVKKKSRSFPAKPQI